MNYISFDVLLQRKVPEIKNKVGIMSIFGSSDHTGLGNNGFEVSLNYITAIPDPNVLTCSNTLKLNFKYLLKRDPSTKEKSIAAMLEYLVENPEELKDDLTIITWVQLYPKLSIDDSKKVRSVSHQIQGQFVSSLGKSYSKYLKDTIGVWLSGLFDPDKSVSRSCNESFKTGFSNKANIISTLWKLYFVQVLNFCQQVIVFETEKTLSDERFATNDESEAKYLRVLKVSIMMMVHSLNELSADAELNEQTLEIVPKIFDSENYQNCFSSNDFSLKSSSYKLLTCLVKSKHVDSFLSKDLYKSLVKAMVKGMKFDSNVNTLLYSPVIIPILSALVSVTKYNSTFWTSIKKPIQKLVDFLKVGSLNSEPAYYMLVENLICIIPEKAMAVDSDDFALLFQTCLDNVLKEINRMFIKEGWEFLVRIVRKFVNDKKITDVILSKFTFFLIKLMDSNKFSACAATDIECFESDSVNVLNDVTLAIENSLSLPSIIYDSYTIQHTDNFISNFAKLLKSSKNEDILNSLLLISIESLENPNETPITPFVIIDRMIPLINDADEIDQVVTFIETIPIYIKPSFTDIPLEVFATYTKSAFADPNVINLIGNEIFNVLEQLGLEFKFIKSMDKIQHLDIKNCQNVNDYLIKQTSSLSLSNSESPDPESSSDLIKIAIETNSFDLLKELYKSSVPAEFCSSCNQNYNQEFFIAFMKLNPEFVDNLFVEICESEIDPLNTSPFTFLQKTLLSLGEKKQLKSTIKHSLINIIRNFETLPKSILQLFSELPAEFVEEFVDSNTLEQLNLWLSKPLLKLLTVNESDDISLYLFLEDSSFEEDIKIDSVESVIDELLLISMFLNHVTFSSFNTDFIILVKFLQDYEKCTGSVSKTYIQKLINLSKKANLDQNWLEIFGDENKVKAYYAYQFLKNSGKAHFSVQDIKKLPNHPASTMIVSETSRSSLTDPSFDFLRNTVLANLLGVRKADDILNEGLKQLVLLNSLINLDLESEISNDFTMIAPNRMNMLLSILTGWCDSEVAYDENFKPVRIAQMQFVEHYINGIYCVCDNNYPTDFIIRVLELGSRLLNESLNMINSKDDISFDLLFASLKLFFRLVDNKILIDSWADVSADTENEIVELFFKISKCEKSSYPLNLIGKQFGLVFEKYIDVKIMKPYYEKLYEVVNSKVIGIQRSACILLDKIIPEIQDNLVVEFALSKKKVDEEGNSSISLPKVLMDNIKDPLSDYIEYEEPDRVYKYLWSWYLTLDHFKNITQQIRQDYINNIGEEVLTNFLNFIFDELKMDRFVAPSLGNDKYPEYVKCYQFKQFGSDDDSEQKELLIICLYEIMNNIGGTFAQHWFQSIRDRQLQQKIEGFMIRYISPLLINDILMTLANKTSIEDSEFKININSTMNEIKCLYHIDEQQMEISIVLPSNFPLSQISVNGLTRVGVNEKKWKSWIMSAQYVINFQNGSILDAIKHFKDNVTANFENYEDCAICYSILNAVDHSTPNKVCPTCKHNFHSACLYRWFKSSSSSTCPLCRSKFQFKKHS